MKKLFKLFALPIIAMFMLLSCTKDDVSAGASSRDVKYEITGNYSGGLIVAAATNNGIAEAFEINKLPWSTSFTAKSSVNTLVLIAANASTVLGKKGEEITLKVFVGGKEVDKSMGTALTDGIIYVSTSPYILK